MAETAGQGMNQAAAKRFITDNIGRHKQFVLATTDDEGKPWAVCLNLCYDEQFNIIWLSRKDTEHSKHIAARPDVAICIFSETTDIGDFGLYLKAQAHEVTHKTELRRLAKLRFSHAGKPAPLITDLLEDAPMRLYYAQVSAAWINDDSHTKVAVDLASLRQTQKGRPPHQKAG